jgi:hypothetical protein
LFVFSFSLMIFASNAFAGSLWCNGVQCSSECTDWDYCVWDSATYTERCPSTCIGSGSSSYLSGYGYSSNYYCDYDGWCEVGELDSCSDCYCQYGNCGYNYYSCSDYGECGTYPNCYSCGYYYGTCNYDGYCDSWESSSCSDCYYNYYTYSYYPYYYDCSYYGTCGYNYCNYGTCPSTTCSHQSPNVVISPNSQQGAIGSTLTYTATVTNNDNSGCGSSTFSLMPTCPSGWSCYLDTSSLSISPGNTGSTTLRVTSPTYTYVGGTNSISVTASSSSGSGTGYASYVISSNCNYGLSISPNSGTLMDNGNWYITANDHSSGCTSSITYTVTYTFSGDCDSSSYASPTSFTINQGSTLSNAITVRGVKRTNTCTVNVNIQSPTGSTVASGSYTVNPYGTYPQYYYPQYNYPQYYYPSYPTYTTSLASQSNQVETATIPCATPYEGEIPKATVYAQSSVSTPNESIYIILILALLFLLLLFALIALIRWLGSRNGSRQKTGKTKEGKSRGFICWSQNGREAPEGF